jgi:hypothetical protein
MRLARKWSAPTLAEVASVDVRHVSNGFVAPSRRKRNCSRRLPGFVDGERESIDGKPNSHSSVSFVVLRRHAFPVRAYRNCREPARRPRTTGSRVSGVIPIRRRDTSVDTEKSTSSPVFPCGRYPRTTPSTVRTVLSRNCPVLPQSVPTATIPRSGSSPKSSTRKPLSTPVLGRVRRHSGARLLHPPSRSRPF